MMVNDIVVDDIVGQINNSFKSKIGFAFFIRSILSLSYNIAKACAYRYFMLIMTKLTCQKYYQDRIITNIFFYINRNQKNKSLNLNKY